MNDAVGIQLRQIMVTYGPEVCEDARKVEALLRDLSGEYRREIFVLASAAREGIPAELLASTGTVSAPVLGERLAQMLQENLGLGEEAARWAVATWASALDLAGYAMTSQAATPPQAARLARQEERTRIDRLLEEAVAAAQSTEDEPCRVTALIGAGTALVSTDPDRATELLIEAERVSLRGELLVEVAAGLAGLGKALATAELARATQLFDHAERLAKWISSIGDRVAAVIAVAEQLTAFDPDRAARLLADAEEFARSGSSFKAELLAHVAKAVVSTDPDHSAQLFDEAERAAKSVADKDWKARQIAQLATELASVDPDRAERLADSIPASYYRAKGLRGVARALASVDPDRAERVAQSILNDHDKKNALADVAEVLAATDLDRAERIYDSIGMRPGVLARTLASSDPERALRLARSIGHEPLRVSVLGSIAVALEVTDPGRAERLLDDAERLARSIPDDGKRATALLDLADVLQSGKASQ